MIDKLKGVFIGVAVIAALAIGGSAIAGAAGGGGDPSTASGDNSKPITGSALKQASDAALAKAGGGKVTQTEAGDEEAAYQVEVTRGDGSQLDVNLDSNFKVVGTKAENETAADQKETDQPGDHQDASDANGESNGDQPGDQQGEHQDASDASGGK
jgi:hypothetical protein